VRKHHHQAQLSPIPLGHDNHRRLCRVYGWEEKKTKASWGGNAVEYRSIAGKAVCEMSRPEVHHFLVVCALVSDLYFSGYNPDQALPKDSKLARTALRYKTDWTPSQAEEAGISPQVVVN